jgi:CHAT domain-containing protein/Tfp pilus assembly protein PilF
MRGAFMLMSVLASGVALGEVRVHAVGNEGAARSANLAEGDEIVAIVSPEAVPADSLDVGRFREVEARRSLVHRVTLRIRRAGKLRNVEVPQGPWDMAVAPGTPEAATPFSQALVTAWDLSHRDQWRELAEHCRKSVAAPFSDAEMRIVRRTCADQIERGGESAVSPPYRAAAVELGRATTADTALAHDLLGAGTALGKLQRFADAEAAINEAREIWRKQAPGALGDAMALSNLAVIASMQGRNEPAQAMWLEVIARYRALGAIPAQEAHVYNNYFLTLRRLGQLDTAQEYLERSIRIKESIDDGSQSLARGYNNLGLLMRQRGDLGAAEQAWSAALAIKRRLDPESLDTQRLLGNLANLALERGDVDTAADLHASTLVVFRKTIPGSPTLAANLRNLAAVRIAQGRLTEARDLLDEALAIELRNATPALSLADTRLALGQVAEARGDLAAAAASYDLALELHQRIAADSSGVAQCLERRGPLAARRGDTNAALTDLRRAVLIRARLAPGSLNEAEARLALSRVHQQAGNRDDALAELRLAAEAVEEQFEHAGASIEGQLGLGPRAAPIYRALIATLASRDQVTEAFAASERYRAQVLRRLLEERDLDLPQRWPEDLRRQRSQLGAQYEQLQTQIGRLPAADPALTEKLAQLAKLRTERMTLAAQMRKALPAPIAAPQPRFSLREAVARLRDGEVMLSYIVSDEATFLFVLRPWRDTPELTMHRIPLGRDALAARISQWRALMRAPAAAGADRDLAAVGRSLHATLLGPAARELEGVRRIALLPDGALWHLPFAALVRGGSDDAPRYLIEDFALNHELAWSLRQSSLDMAAPVTPATHAKKLELAAFGDPVLTPALAARFPPLPATRDELRGLGGVFGAAATLRLGSLATEPELLRLAPGARYVHIASHAVARPALPLDSSILLTADAKSARPDNALRALEIIERLRLDAELVTLSACDTGSGAELGGEGLVGLTWAFRFAGAQAVLASLWPVGDRSTADLMTDFYRRLAAGATKDDALRGAQLAALERGRGARGARMRGPASAPGTTAAQPVRWAAFGLFGQP